MLSCKLVSAGRSQICPTQWSQKQLETLECLCSGVGIHPTCSRDCLTLDVEQGSCWATRDNTCSQGDKI